MSELSQQEIQERLKNLSPEQMQELIKQQCVFCKIIAGDIPSHKIYEDNNFLAFLDVNPACAGHTLVIPKQHVSVLPQMPDQLAAALFVLVKNLAGKVFEATSAEGLTILQRNGQVAGQVVPHVHVHIIPRYADDKVQDGWEPQKLSEEQFKDIQEKIVKTLSQPQPAPKPEIGELTPKPQQKPEIKAEVKKEEIKKKEDKRPRVKSKLP